MWTQMINTFFVNAVLIIKLMLLSGASSGLTLPYPDDSKRTWIQKITAAIDPLITQTNKCEAIKSIFGITYQQMIENNASDINLGIDLITAAGNVKYNLTMNKRLGRMLQDKKTIVVLVHGFMESSDGIMVNGLAPGLLKQPNMKILALDGRRLVNLEYFRASTHARLMGEKLGNFLNDMVENGLNPSNIVLIGHSLGAHIAGVAGKRLTELSGTKVGRIMGLDPAAPCFGAVEPQGRLVPGDADLVMAVHTNGGTLGLLEPVGDIDWYPNGGKSQPGCYLYTCSHSRAWELLAESIITPDHFPGRKCDSWENFQSGRCSKNPVAFLGLNQELSESGTYFFSTSGSSPYGLGPTGINSGISG